MRTLPNLLKNRGIRKPLDREVGAVPPKFELVPCWRGVDMWGFMGKDIGRAEERVIVVAW